MIKKFKSIFIAVLFCLLIPLSVCAEVTFSIDAGKDFLVYPQSKEELAKILNMKTEDIKAYCEENNILYLAADKNNTRQIRLSVYTNTFSSSVGNISTLSNDKITALAEDISGFEGVRGEIVKKGEQKFLKIQLRSDDSGGGYILTQYITVAQKQNMVLSFYNSENVNPDYINSVFDSFESPLFEKAEEEGSKTLQYIIPAATILLLVICVILGFSIVKDLKSADETENDDSQEN